MGDPWFKQKICFVAVAWFAFSSNYELYADMSNRVMSTLEELSPRVEIYSIDEAFCDLTGVRNCRDLTDFGREIRATVLQRTHLTVGVGIAQTKTLAACQSCGKKWQRQTGGVVDLSNLERQRKLMSALPVDDVWGLDGGSAKTGRDGDQTVLDLADTDIRFIRKHFNVVLKERCESARRTLFGNWKSLHRRKQGNYLFPARLVNASRIIHRCGRPFVVTLRAAEKLRGEHQYCRFISAIY